MGAEQSSEQDNRGRRNNRQQQQSSQGMSQAEVQRILNTQRQEYERRCQEMLANAQNANAQQTAAASTNLERERAPYQYSRNDLHGIGAQNSLYPNLNANVPHSSASVNNSYQRQSPANLRPPQDYVFVNNHGQPERAPMPTAPPAPRERSVSRNRNTEDTQYNCPTCHCRYGLEIYLCPSGHSACSVCKTAGRNCRLCGQYFIDKRNYALETLMSQVKVACPNANDGCKLFISNADMATHVKECPFKEQQCPLAAIFGNCHWIGKLNQISKHFDSMHSAQRQTDVDTEIHLTNINHNSQQVHLVLLGTYNFLFHIKVSEQDRNIYMTCQLIGTKMSASRWTYEVHVYNKSQNRRKFTYIDSCTSSCESVAAIFKDGACAVLPVAYATTFVNDGILTFKFFIKKSNEGFRDFDNMSETEVGRQKRSRSRPRKGVRSKGNREMSLQRQYNEAV